VDEEQDVEAGVTAAETDVVEAAVVAQYDPAAEVDDVAPGSAVAEGEGSVVGDGFGAGLEGRLNLVRPAIIRHEPRKPPATPNASAPDVEKPRAWSAWPSTSIACTHWRGISTTRSVFTSGCILKLEIGWKTSTASQSFVIWMMHRP
jgi:hypothetical protein